MPSCLLRLVVVFYTFSLKGSKVIRFSKKSPRMPQPDDRLRVGSVPWASDLGVLLWAMMLMDSYDS